MTLLDVRTSRPVWDVGNGVRRRAGVEFGKDWQQFPELSADQIKLIEADPYLEVRESSFAQLDIDSLSSAPIVEPTPTPVTRLKSTARRRRRAAKV